MNLPEQIRARRKFVNVVEMLPMDGGYLDYLPPAAQDIVRAARIMAAKFKELDK